MTRLTKWEDINKEKTRGVVGQRLTALDVHLLKTFENVFEGNNSTMQAHQCHKCGGLFTISNEEIDICKKENEQLICQNCAEQPNQINEKNYRWRQYVKATRLIEGWEKIRTDESFKLLKHDLAKIIEFNTVGEMYIRYYDLYEKARKDNFEISLGADPKIQEILSVAFDDAKARNYEEFVKMVWKINRDELEEIQKMLNVLESAWQRAELEYWLIKIIPHTTFSTYIGTKKQLDNERIRYHLLIYGQLVELNFIYDVMYNLARIKNTKSHLEKPFPPDDAGRHISPDGKVRIICKEDSRIGELFCRFFVQHLRNAIAHAKYRIDDKFVYKTDTIWKMPIEQVKNKVSITRSVFSALLRRITAEQAEMIRQQTVTHGDDTFTFQIS